MDTKIDLRKLICFILLVVFTWNTVEAGISVVGSDGMRFTGADGVDFIGTNGLRFTGADGFINTEVNGLRFTGADGIRFTGADGTRFTGADGITYIGSNGARFTGADGIDLTKVDGMRFTGADGFRFTGADGTTYEANSIVVRRASGVSLLAPAGISLIGTNGLRFTGADGDAVSADGLRFTGADTIRFTGADSLTGFGPDGVLFELIGPAGFSITGLDGMRFTGADTVFTVIDGLRFTGADGIELIGPDGLLNQAFSGLQSVDPELALLLNQVTDDSGINAVVVFHQYPTDTDLNNLRQIGILGGTRFRVLPMIYVTATREQLMAISQLANVRSIYGNRTLKFDSDPYFKPTQVSRVPADSDLRTGNNNLPVTGKNVTVAVLDTGVNALHHDLSGKVIQNVKLLDLQSLPLGFNYPLPIENFPNTDLLSGHGTFVSGIIAGSGSRSNGKYNGVAPGAKILGLSAGDVNLAFVLSGFDYLLQKGPNYHVRVVNCSFSTEAVFDYNDPVNIATRMLTDSGVSVVFSAGNTGPGNNTLNPYAAAPWVISVGATDEKSVLADFSSRGVFGDKMFSPSLVAPGINVISLRSLGTQVGTLGLLGADTQRLTLFELPFYTTASGTSFSAPQVSGAIALMLEANPGLSPAQIKDILQRSATPLPRYFAHEVGAGMLNTYAAVLEAAFPERATGTFRAAAANNGATFSTSTFQVSNGQVSQGSVISAASVLPLNTVLSNFYVAWEKSSPANLNLKVFDGNGYLAAISNRPHFNGIFGRNEKASITLPATANLLTQISSQSTIPQNFLAATEVTQVNFGELSDTESLSAAEKAIVYEGLRKFLLAPAGAKFEPDFAVSRAEFAAALVRIGKAPQFVAKSPLYPDVTDLTTRNAVESVQSVPAGALICDAIPVNGPGNSFRPDQPVTRLIAAIALVKAAQLDSLAAGSVLPGGVTDVSEIPPLWRGYVAVALQKGWLTQNEAGKFSPDTPLTRMDLITALIKLSK
jgi:serine protease AprX